MRRSIAATVLGLLLAATAGCGTTEQSPAPTEPPQTPVPTINSALVAFRQRVDAALQREGRAVRDLATASAGDPAGMAQPAAILQALVLEELAWARENPPDPCFAAAHAAYVEGMTKLGDAGDRFRALAERPPPSEPATSAGGPDPAAAAAAALLVEGGDGVAAALRLADAARGTCS